ncbi:hypothetical protein FB451DRAFT_1166675 [Mycena latifolia]|nr:hypothetical protein FB451DRAFT_1166675 [Mycena latifolia]
MIHGRSKAMTKRYSHPKPYKLSKMRGWVALVRLSGIYDSGAEERGRTATATTPAKHLQIPSSSLSLLPVHVSGYGIAITTPLLSSAALPIPAAAPQLYEPLAKAVLRRRLTARIFPATGALCVLVK